MSLRASKASLAAARAAQLARHVQYHYSYSTDRGEYCADLSDLDSDPKTCKIDSLDIRGKPQGLTSPDTNLYQGVL